MLFKFTETSNLTLYEFVFIDICGSAVEQAWYHGSFDQGSANSGCGCRALSYSRYRSRTETGGVSKVVPCNTLPH